MKSTAANRLSALNSQFGGNMVSKVKNVDIDGQQYSEIIDHEPHIKIKMDYHKTQGWGYHDSEFVLKDTKNGPVVTFSGDKYLYSGHEMPEFFAWAQTEVALDEKQPQYKQTEMHCDPPKNVNHEFLKALEEKKCFSRRSFDHWERIMHSHGASLREIFSLRYGKFERYVDVVVYPGSTQHTTEIVQLAHQHNVIVVPYGGGTNVTQALWIKEGDEQQGQRMIVSLDMSRMDRILWVDKDNMIACVQAGIRGTILEQKLKQQGVVSGHEPDSSEFSTLGGWISTRASGMKKNTYGNIEEIVQGFTFVTPSGTYKKLEHWPRISAGPDFHQLIMGHEGNLGVVTEAIIRVRPNPDKVEFGSFIFPNFKVGIKFMEEMSKQRMYPTSLRLVDNVQFQFGQALKPAEPSRSKKIIDKIKKFYILNVKGFKADEMVAATTLCEGPKDVVDMNMKTMGEIAKKYGGLSAGAENGIKGYQLTYMIAYIRDFCMQYNVVAESFETSCPWSQVQSLCINVQEDIYKAAEAHGFDRKKVFCSFRVTQLYETGAAIYVYFALPYGELENKAEICDIYEDVENKSRESVFKNGGSISHHHGVGKLRKRFMGQMTTNLNSTMMAGAKQAVDPKNIFAINNTIYRSEEEARKDHELDDKYAKK